jgi:NAD+ synthase
MVVSMSIELIFTEEQLEVVKKFTIEKIKEANTEGAVIGVSGGLDSAVVFKICSLILPKDNISPVFLPESTTPDQDTKDAHLIADELQIPLLEIKIDDIMQLYLEIMKNIDKTPLVIGNLKARVRMNLLYLIANSLNRLVIGTSNKSELLLGYFTKFGDGGSDVAPLGDLYKTQVWALAKHLAIPKQIISKPPTAGLIKDQNDEDELGLNYKTIDKILYGLELEYTVSRIADELSIKPEIVESIKQKMELNRHKRKFSKIPKLGIKTIGVDLYE